MEGIRHGAAGYLLKPFNVTELLSLINQTLEKKQRLDFLRHFSKTSTGLWGSETECAQAWKELRTGYQAIGKPTFRPCVQLRIHAGPSPSTLRPA